jgi:hypothetical protein
MFGRLRVLCSRIRALFTRGRSDRDFDEELDTHLNLLTHRFLCQGMTREDATRAARRQLGGIAQLKEEQYENSGLPHLERFVQDILYALTDLSSTVPALLFRHCIRGVKSIHYWSARASIGEIRAAR